MGRLTHEPYIQHLSHPHRLELTNQQALNTTTAPLLLLCSACKLPFRPSEWIYSCSHCNFGLHVSCAQLPLCITHPSHPKHALSLLLTSPYPGGLFNCDACGLKDQTGFCYHCKDCCFDLHTLCASTPSLILHHSHPHQLSLRFEPPYYPNSGFACDICRKIGTNHWLYRCDACQFDAHLDCATNISSQPHDPHFNTHFNSFPTRQYPAAASGGMNNYHAHSQSLGPMSNYRTPTPNRGNGLMDSITQGFVEGAAQQAGQNFVQSFTSDGGGGGDSSSSSSIINIGSSILTGLFGDSGNQN